MDQFPVERITHEVKENELIYTLGYTVDDDNESNAYEMLAEKHTEISGYLNDEGKIIDSFKTQIEEHLKINIDDYMYQILECSGNDANGKAMKFNVFILTTKTNAHGPVTYDEAMSMTNRDGGTCTIAADRLSDETIHLLKCSDAECSVFLDSTGKKYYYITNDQFDITKHYFIAQMVPHFANRTIFETQLPAVERMPSQVWEYINTNYTVTTLDSSTNLCVMSPNDPTPDEAEQVKNIVSVYNQQKLLNTAFTS